MHDLAVVAVHKDGRFGFKIMAAGGLGHKPYHALTLEEFVEERDLFACMEAVLSLHNRYSDRKRRARSRVKFLVDKFGRDGFVEKYREELQRSRPAYAGYDYPKGVWKKGEGGEIPFPGARCWPRNSRGGLFSPSACPSAISLRRNCAVSPAS